MTDEKTHTEDQEERQKAIETLSNMIIENKTAMLVSSGSDHVIRSRPMLNLNERFDGELYFITEAGGEVARSYKENPQCNISISEPTNGTFVSLTGKASIEDNAKKLELIWNDACKKWFDSDSPNSDLRLVRVDVTDAELWKENRSFGSRLGSFVGVSDTTVKHASVDWSSRSSDHPASEPAATTLSLMGHHAKSGREEKSD